METIIHLSDADCIASGLIDDSVEECLGCHVSWSGDPCLSCSGVAYHYPGCPESDETEFPSEGLRDAAIAQTRTSGRAEVSL